MKLSFPDASLWSAILRGAAKVIRESTLKVEPEGLRLRAMDPSRVVMIDLFIPADSFSEYEGRGERLTVNLEELSKLLRRAAEDEELVLEAKRGGIELTLRGRITRRIRVPLLNIEVEELGELRIPFKADAAMPAEVFAETLKLLEPMGDVFGLMTDEDKLTIFNESELGRYFVELTTEAGGGLLSLEAEGEQRSIYSMEYVANFVYPAESAEQVRLQFSTDMPCKITFELPRGAQFAVYVAPRTL